MALGKSNVAIDIQIKNVQKITELKNSLKSLRKEQRDIEKATKEGSKSQGISSKRYKDNSKAIDGQSKSLRGLNRNQKDVTKSSGSMSKSFIKGAAAIGIVVGAFRLIGRTIGSFISTFTEFEFVMAKVHAVSGATSEEFKKLTASAEELGRTTFYTASQVGELQLAYSKLGFTAREINQASEATINLATATGSDLQRASQVAGATIRGFGLDASETGRVVDVMAVSFASSAMDIEKWSTSMTKVAPIAQSAGFSIEDTAAMMSKLTDAGIEASIAGTSLRNILLKMQDPTSALSQSFGGTIHSLDELVPAMEKFVLEGGSMADVMEVVDIRQAAAFETLLMSSDSILQYRDNLQDANGEGARMAAMVGDTLQGSFLKVKSAVQGVSISIMKNFSGALKDNMVRLASWLNMLAKHPSRLKDVIFWIKATVRAILSVVVGMKAMRIITKANVILQNKFTLSMGQSTVALTMAKKATIAFSASMRAVKAALVSTGIGAIVVLLGELAASLMFSQSATEKAEMATTQYGESIEEMGNKKQTEHEIDLAVTESTRDRIAIVGSLVEKFGDLNTTDKEREGILRTLYKLSSDHFADLLVGIENTDALTAAQNRYVESIKKEEGDKASVAAYKKAQINNKKLQEDEAIRVKDVNKRAKGINKEAANLRELLKKPFMVKSQFLSIRWLEAFRKEYDIQKAALDSVKEKIQINIAVMKKYQGVYDESIEAQGDSAAEEVANQDRLDETEVRLARRILSIKRRREEGQTGAEWAKEEARAIAEATKSDLWHQYNNLKASERNLSKGVDMLVKIQDIELTLEKMHIADLVEANKVGQIKRSKQMTTWLKFREQVRLGLKEIGDKTLINDYEASQELLKNKQEDLKASYELLSEEEKLSSKGLAMKHKIDEVALKRMKLHTKEKMRILKGGYIDEQLELDMSLVKRKTSKSAHDIAMLDLSDKYIKEQLVLVKGDIKAEEKLYDDQAKNDLKRLKITNKDELDIQSDADTTAKLNLQMERAQTEMSDIAYQQRQLDLEGDALKRKAILYKDDADMMRDIKNEQLAHDIKVFETQQSMREQAISAMGGVGSALTSLAGDNEKLNAVKEIGNAISMVTNTLTTIQTLKTNLNTLADIKGTGATIGNTIATTLGLIPKAISTILASAAKIPFPLNIIAIAATYKLLKKVMKFEEGGVVEGKYANGGMVHGPSHANGGVKFAVGGRVNELEGGEAVINKRSTAMFRNQLSSMNQAGGGVKFADGGLMSSPAFAESQFNANNQNQMIGAMNGQRKVVVVESDITTSQSTVSVIQSNASF